jgi:hypothetical protein
MYLSYDLKDYLKQGDNVIEQLSGTDSTIHLVIGARATDHPGSSSRYTSITPMVQPVNNSDETWKVSFSPITMDLVYDGEHYMPSEQQGWCKQVSMIHPGNMQWTRKAPEGKMKAHMSPPTRSWKASPP